MRFRPKKLVKQLGKTGAKVAMTASPIPIPDSIKDTVTGEIDKIAEVLNRIKNIEEQLEVLIELLEIVTKE